MSSFPPPPIRVGHGIRGRGIFADEYISPSTVIEISPVILFPAEEYQQHGKYTLLDHYTFNWPRGEMALALGLGSLFNHSESPNVSFTLDTSGEAIKFTTTKPVQPGEELCIFYGHKLWFQPAELNPSQSMDEDCDDAEEDPFLSLSQSISEEMDNPFLEGCADDVVSEGDLPFRVYKLPPEEEDIETVKTARAWAVDIPDPRECSRLLKWLLKEGLDTPDLSHLKRIRKLEGKTTLLLTIAEQPPDIPSEFNLPPPFSLPVPTSAAVTMPSLNAKSHFWPSVYAPRRKDELPERSRGEIRCAWDAMRTTITAALSARTAGELPIAAHVPIIPEGVAKVVSSRNFVAHDTRKSATHSLKHAIPHLVADVAEWRAACSNGSDASSDLQNGTHYLLTGQTLFTTHEPCIMCSMALLHSRVKEVHYLIPMPLTGGCGGAACLPSLPSVNHRFRICAWKADLFPEVKELRIDETIDA